MKVGDKVKIVNEKRWYNGCVGVVREENIKGFVVSFSETNPLLYGEYGEEELELVEEGQA